SRSSTGSFSHSVRRERRLCLTSAEVVMENPACPWQEKPSILSLLRAWDGSEDLDLSEEKDPPFPAQPGFPKIYFAAGLEDRLARAPGGKSERDVLDDLFFALERLVKADTDTARLALYESVCKERVIHFTKAILQRLPGHDTLRPAALRPHARWLI